jgi:hypothetical protein
MQQRCKARVKIHSSCKCEPTTAALNCPPDMSTCIHTNRRPCRRCYGITASAKAMLRNGSSSPHGKAEQISSTTTSATRRFCTAFNRCANAACHPALARVKVTTESHIKHLPSQQMCFQLAATSALCWPFQPNSQASQRRLRALLVCKTARPMPAS